MRLNQIVLGLAITMGYALFAQMPAAAQEHRGTVEQQMACTPDVFRLCGSQIPDEDRIVACLRQNTPQLSRACRAVFETTASVPPPAAPRRDYQPRDPQPRAYNPPGYAPPVTAPRVYDPSQPDDDD